jgi:phage portal protein BeeE
VSTLWQRARRGGTRSISTLDDYIGAMDWWMPTVAGITQTAGGQPLEKATPDFAGLAAQMMGRNSIVWSCMLARQSVFSAVRFQWQRFNQGRPSEMFGTQDLAVLEEPWTGGTTQDLLARMLIDADLAGNSYWTTMAGAAVRMRPDWVDIALAARIPAGVPGAPQLGWERLGYAYYEDGDRGHEPVVLLPEQVVHFAPLPDPLATYRGMSWLSPLIREIEADNLMTGHRRQFFQHGATPNLIVKHAPGTNPDQAKAFKDRLDAEYGGVENAYKTMHIGGGADVTIAGRDFQQIDFKAVQGHGETRIAAAAGVPPIIAGFSEGLSSATYSNYAQARRRFADGTIHPLWGNAAGSLSKLVRKAPAGVRLWYDARDVAFLREDSKDAADIAQTQAATMRQLIDAGYKPDAVIHAVTSGDMSLLAGQHSGLYSVQLQPAGSTPAAASTNPDGSNTAPTGGTDT